MSDSVQVETRHTPKAAVVTQPVAQNRQPDTEFARKKSAGHRIAELLAERKTDRDRIRELERQLSEKQSPDLQREVEQLRAELQKHQGDKQALKARIPIVVAEARRIFPDFDQVVQGIPIDPKAFDGIIAAANAPEALYAIASGMHLIRILNQRNAQAKAERDRIEHYRRLHEQHFADTSEIKEITNGQSSRHTL